MVQLYHNRRFTVVDQSLSRSEVNIPTFTQYSVPCIQRTLYTAYPVYSVPCIQRTLYTACPVYSVPCIQRALYTAYPVYSVPCIQRTLYTAYPVYSVPCIQRTLYTVIICCEPTSLLCCTAQFAGTCNTFLRFIVHVLCPEIHYPFLYVSQTSKQANKQTNKQTNEQANKHRANSI